jgi:2-polyprenyl-3-methyl-5-hydroxy-6-metoxy-1,4-benzoquinol methylase
MNKDFLKKVGLEYYKPSDFVRRTVILRDERRAALWLHQKSGHGILDEKYWENIEEDYYENDYRNDSNASLDKSTMGPAEHLEIYRNLNQRQYAQFSSQINGATKYLEVGCSFGGVLSHVVKAEAALCSAVEPNKRDVEFLTAELPMVNVFEGMFEDFETPARYNLMASFEVLEHTVSPLAFAKKCYELMEPGGFINIEVPNHHDILLQYDAPAYKNFYYHKAHIHYFTPDSLDDLFTYVGFEGQVSSFLMYPFFNHMFWHQNNKPQKSASLALSTPSPFVPTSPAQKEISGFYKNVEREYESLVNKHLLGDCLVFQGRKR